MRHRGQRAPQAGPHLRLDQDRGQRGGAGAWGGGGGGAGGGWGRGGAPPPPPPRPPTAPSSPHPLTLTPLRTPLAWLQTNLGRQLKEMLQVPEQTKLGFMAHSDAKRDDRRAKERYTV